MITVRVSLRLVVYAAECGWWQIGVTLKTARGFEKSAHRLPFTTYGP